MELKVALLADAANVSVEGKLNILGEFGIIWARQVPVSWPLMQLVLRLEATAAEGPRHRLGIRAMNEDGQLVAQPVDIEVDFGPPFRPGLPHRGQFVLGIQGATFLAFGQYGFEILVDGHSVGSVPLHILPQQVPPPAA
jgi:hypothetical protein